VRIKQLPVLGASLLFPLLLAAQEGHEASAGHAEGWMAPIWHVPMLVWQIVNLLLVVGLFIYLLRRPAPKFFADRAGEIEALLEAATREKEEALARLGEVEGKMTHLQEEVRAIEESSAKAAEADKQRVLDEAEAMRERIRKEAREEIERRLLEARRELRVYAADMAVALAREALAKGITDQDESRLRADFLGRLEESAHERDR
jgi:F-type H+-transporting ATPase subunit b